MPYNNIFKYNTQRFIYHNINDDNEIIKNIFNNNNSYTINELYQLIENECNLNIIDFYGDNCSKLKDNILNITYNSNIEKYSTNELFFSDIYKHRVYISNNKNISAKVYDLENIIIINKKEVFINIVDFIKDEYNKNNTDNIINIPMYEYGFCKCISNNSKYVKCEKCIDLIGYIKLNICNITINILDRINNNSTIETILKLNFNANLENLLKYFKPIFDEFNKFNILLLKKP